MAIDLSSLPSLREVVDRNQLRAEKKLGQNFILDQNITDKIVKCAGDISSHHAIEIGPGPGGLTRALLSAGARHVTAIEYDDRAIHALTHLVDASQGQLTLLKQDALEANLISLCDGPRVIVANLPYNISTVLLLRWLYDLYNNSGAYDRMILMFQKEVAERLVAKPNCKDYGRLSVMTQWIAEARIMFDVPPHIFVPPPKVTSSIVEIIPRRTRQDKALWEHMESILAAGFGQRRKMIRSSLSNYQSCYEAAGIEPTVRAENISVSDYIRMAEVMNKS